MYVYFQSITDESLFYNRKDIHVVRLL